MRKKTFKIFISTFTLSLFLIWAANGLLALPPVQSNSSVSIPEKNIALFFQHDAPMINYASSAPIQASSLSLPTPKEMEREPMIDEGLFSFEDMDENTGVKLSSVEEAADIPLESMNSVTLQDHDTSILYNTQKEVTVADNTTNILIKDNPIVLSELSINNDDDQAKPQNDGGMDLVDNTQEDLPLIPLEFEKKHTPEKIEIANKAPDNQIAMADANNIKFDDIAVDQTASLPSTSSKEWYQMSDKIVEDSPWVVAKGTRNPKNNHVLEEQFYKGLNESEISAALGKPQKLAEDDKEYQVAEMVKNILIPIPEDILNDKNLTPQLVSPKKNKKSAEENIEEPLPSSEKNSESKGILKSITSIFSSSDNNTKTDNGDEAEDTEEPSKHRGLFSVFGKEKSSAKILPAEMRLSFQPGRAEISGTTLRWIQAFANKVIEDANVILEIRIDRTSSFELQQKRLNLLYSILTNKGVSYDKINTVFTSREPNSFIIRTLRINEHIDNTTQKNRANPSLYYQSW